MERGRHAGTADGCDARRDRTDLVAAPIGENRRRGVDPDPCTASARWKFERLIPDQALFRAGEAVG